MPLITRLIISPSEGTRKMLERRMRLSSDDSQKLNWGAVLLIQASVVEMFEAVDVATKASNVTALEVLGSCPQHINTVGLIGGVADAKQALEAVKRII